MLNMERSFGEKNEKLCYFCNENELWGTCR